MNVTQKYTAASNTFASSSSLTYGLKLCRECTAAAGSAHSINSSAQLLRLAPKVPLLLLLPLLSLLPLKMLLLLLLLLLGGAASCSAAAARSPEESVADNKGIQLSVRPSHSQPVL
jgi:hypothetical protein